MGTEFGILGPVEVRSNGAAIDIGGPREQKTLAVLLLSANRAVSVSRLIDVLWGDEPPATSRAQIRNSVTALRRGLSTGDIPEQVPIVWANDGFSIQIDDDQLDAARFDRQVAHARKAADHGRLATASDLLQATLALWRGPALAGLGGAVLSIEAHRLEEKRLACLENRIELDLMLGRHGDLVGELAVLVAEYPLREHLLELHMLALYRAGRRQDALAAFTAARRALAEQVGLDPRPELQQLEQAILRAEPKLLDHTYLPPWSAAASGGRTPERPPARRPQVPIPAQLAGDIADFTGRVGESQALAALACEGQPARAARVICVTGTAGVGKTALAVHWAHGVRDRFADGQLYVNLRGYAAGAVPLRPIEVLARFLHGLGVPAEQVPTEVDEAAAMYRSLLAGRRVLVLLDNAATAEQVRPLLPASAGCLVLVTSRDSLGGLVARDGARRLGLDVLAADEAVALLGGILGADRIAGEPAATAELARLCAYLPLALRVAAAHLADRRHRRIAEHVADLRTGDSLARFTVDGDEQAGVQAAFELSYRALAEPARRLFRLLGLVPGPDATAAAAAALAGSTPAETATLLDRLSGAHLVDEHSAGRYTFHDLLRRYAAQRSADEDAQADRAVAVGRLLAWYLHGADAAARCLYPELQRLPFPADADLPATTAVDDPSTATAWMDAEWGNLVAAARHAAAYGPRPIAWLLTDTTRGYFAVSGHSVDWLSIAEAGHSAAVEDGDLPGQAAAHLALGLAKRRMSRLDEAVAHYTEASALAEQAGWPQGQGAALGSLASVYGEQGSYEHAVDLYHRACAIYRETGGRGGEAVIHGNLGAAYIFLGRLDDAAVHLGKSLAICEEIGSDGGRAHALTGLGNVYQMQGRLDEALDHLDQALQSHRVVGSRVGEADTLLTMAEVQQTAGRYTQAIELAEAALAVARLAEQRRIEVEALNVLGTAYEHLGEHVRAADHHRDARKLAQEMGYPRGEIVGLTGTAAALLGMGLRDDAAAHARQAVTLAQPAGFRVLREHATATLAAIAAAQGARVVRRR